METEANVIGISKILMLEIQKQPFVDILQKIRRFHRRPATLLERNSNTGFFSVKSSKFLITPFLQNPSDSCL